MKITWRAQLMMALTVAAPLRPARSEPAHVFPGADWQRRTPAELGFDERALQKVLPVYGIGGVIVRHGYLAASWGNPDVALQTASMGKAFTGTVLGLAVSEGKVKLDDPVWKTWTGERELSHPYKYMNFGYQVDITWRHMVTMTAGFPNEEVFIPGGEMGDMRWTYARRPPGVRFEYTDPGMWRFSQALTKLWYEDIKQVMDDKIFSKIGVPASRWDWLPGKDVRDLELYPEIPGYGAFLDPPYEIDGHVVRGGSGWIVISAADLARFGYLMLRHGRWGDKQLLSEHWVTEAIRPQVRMSEVLEYGYNWWVYHGGKVFAARGISLGWAAISSVWVFPDLDLVISFIRTNPHVRDEKEALRKNNWDERDWPFQVADTIIHAER